MSVGWTAADLFGLHTPPEKPHPSYNRLSRYDCTGLIWLLEGRPVVALTADTASIRNPKTGNVARAAELKISDRYRIIDERPIGKFDETPLFPALAIPAETKRAFECPTEGDAEIRALRSSSS